MVDNNATNYHEIVTLQLSNDEELRKFVDRLFPEKVSITISTCNMRI